MQALAAIFVSSVALVGPACEGGETAFADVQQPAALTTVDVLAMMRAIPEKAHQARPGRYDQAGDAREIAAGIAHVVTDRDTAALLSVYAAYESSNVKCAEGDRDANGIPKSLGAFQLQGVPREVACDPARAASVWLALAKDAQANHCQDSDPDDRLSILTGGSCTRGRLVARTRARIAREVAKATP